MQRFVLAVVLLTAVMSTSAAARRPRAAAPTVTASLIDGAVTSDVVTVTARVLSDIGVAKVEFSVDDQLRATVTKPPYEYKWDTVDEDEGRHTFVVAAYDADGMATSRRIKVEVDNGLSLGVKPHADTAQALFDLGEFDKAMLEGRKAYRINNADPDAIRALAAGTGGTGNPNRGIELLEVPQRINNQVIGDPKSFPMSDARSLRLRGVFRILRAEKATDTRAAAADLATAYDLCMSGAVTDLAAARARYAAAGGSPSDADVIALGDALFAHRSFGDAAAAYAKVKDSGRLGVAAQNRAALALIYAERLREAEELLTGLVADRRADAASHALLGSIYLRRFQFDQARREVDDGARAGSPTSLLVAAYADLAKLDFTRAYDELLQIARHGKAVERMPEVQYLASCIFTDTRDAKQASAALFATLRRDPLNLDCYVLRGLQMACLDAKSGCAQALPLFDLVLKHDPDRVGAMLGKTMALVQLRQYRLAEPLAKRLAREEHAAPDALAVTATYYAGDANLSRANDALAEARRIDPVRFNLLVVPLVGELAPRVAHYRRAPLITPGLLALG